MISQTQTKLYVCRHCGSKRLRRNGRSRRGAQRGQCLECGKTLVLEPHLPPDYLCRATRSDLWLSYEAVFPAHTHRLCPKQAGETSHAERFFCTARQRISRLVRKTLSFSKSFDMHELWLRLFLVHYNLQF